MAVNYPGSSDVFTEPSLPEETSLSSAGSGGTRNHFEHHRDLGDAIEAVETNASLSTHDHSGVAGNAHGSKLAQANTHQSADTDTSAAALHHTIGSGPYQAAAGNHVHGYIICTSTTRPTPYRGLLIFQTDTKQLWVYTDPPSDIYSLETRTRVTPSGPGWYLVWPLPAAAPTPTPIPSQPETPVAQPYQPVTVQLSQTTPQQIRPDGSTLEFQQINWDTAGFVAGAPGNYSSVTAPFTGQYTVNAGVVWDPTLAPNDSQVTVLVNGQNTNVASNQGLLGSNTPGISQTSNGSGTLYLQQGDQVSVQVGYTPKTSILDQIFSFAGDTQNAQSNFSLTYNGYVDSTQIGAGLPGQPGS